MRWRTLCKRILAADPRPDSTAAGGPAERVTSAAESGLGPAAREQLRAIDAERARIYEDLHDDIGARLVSILSISQDPRITELAHDALRELRAVVYHARGTPGTLAQVLGEIRGELAERLEPAGWSLSWEEDGLPDVILEGERSIHVYRIVREAATNAIKHSPPGELRLRARATRGMLYIDITDQCRSECAPRQQSGTAASTAGTPAAAGTLAEPPGMGLRGMRERAQRLGGRLEVEPGTLQGTKVILHFPLPPTVAGGS